MSNFGPAFVVKRTEKVWPRNTLREFYDLWLVLTEGVNKHIFFKWLEECKFYGAEFIDID